MNKWNGSSQAQSRSNSAPASKFTGWFLPQTTSGKPLLPVVRSVCQSLRGPGRCRPCATCQNGERRALGPGEAWNKARRRTRADLCAPLTQPARAGWSRGKTRFSLSTAATHHGEPRPAAPPAWRREAQGQGSVLAGQACSALRWRRAPAVGTRAEGHSHHLQHERAQVHRRSLHPAQRVRRQLVWAGKGTGRGPERPAWGFWGRKGCPPLDACARWSLGRGGRGLAYASSLACQDPALA